MMHYTLLLALTATMLLGGVSRVADAAELDVMIPGIGVQDLVVKRYVVRCNGDGSYDCGPGCSVGAVCC